MKTIRLMIIFVLLLTMYGTAAAGNGKGGGGPAPTPTPVPLATPTPDTGELYGDLYVILRNENGVPILSAQGCIQPISAVTDSTSITTNGAPIILSVTQGEPFALPTYTDAAGDLVECELTEDMADWVIGVDFGRLNLGRAPAGVIAHAFDEAINKMNVATTMRLDPAGRLVMTLPDAEDPTISVEKTIDAPAENLALYIEMMKYGDWILEDRTPIVNGNMDDTKGPPEGDGPSKELRPLLNSSAIELLNNLGFTNLGVSDTNKTLNNAEFTLAASLLAAAADKTGSITLDKVMYINSIYGINQLGSIPGEIEGKTYYNFGTYEYHRGEIYGVRGSPECVGVGSNYVYVLQPEADTDGNPLTLHYVTTCVDILGYEAAHDPLVNAVHFTDMVEQYATVSVSYDFTDNVRAFIQAADDALQVIEYIHNYKVPEVLYP